MGLRIIYGKAGSGKSRYCLDEIANIINKEKKIYIITPEQFSFTAEKKLMETIKTDAVLNAEVITLSRMAYRVLSEVGGMSATNLSKCGKAMLIYSVLASNKSKLKFLGKTDENLSLAQNAINEFKKHGISVECLKNEAQNTQDLYLKTKLEDMILIYENFENQISGKYIEETDLLTFLSEKIEETELFKDSVIYIDEFAGFTVQEYEIIKKLIKIAKSVSITICIDNCMINTNPDEDIFYSNKITLSKILSLSKNIEKIYLEGTKRFKADELKFLEENLYSIKPTKYGKDVENVNLFLAKNQYLEVEEVAKKIIKLVKENEYRYKDISVITKNIDTYSSLVRAIFSKYEIPVFIDEKRDLNQNIIVQYVLSILEIFNKNWSYESVFNYIKSGFLKLDEEEIFKLENYCIKWGIKQSKWKKEFNYGIIDEASKQDVERLETLRKEIVNPLMELKENFSKNKTAMEMSKALYEFLISQDIENKLEIKIRKLEELGLIDLANEYVSSYKIIIDILDEIVLVFRDDKMSIDKFYQIIKIGLKNSGLGKIPGTQDQVIVGDVDRSRSHKVKAIFIIGLNDGVFPSVNKDEGFFNDNDRDKLKTDGIELAKGTIENLYEDNFNIYKAFTTAEEKLFLSFPLADLDGKSLRPSILISKIKKIFPKLKEESVLLLSTDEILTKNTTYEELIKNIAKLNDGEKIDDIWYDVYNYYKGDELWNKKLEADLKGIDYTNLPGKISKENIEKLYGKTLVTSISKLEQFRRCPFSYYLQYGLKLQQKEELKIKTLNTGTFMHETIDEFFNRVSKKYIDEIDSNENAGINSRLEKLTDEELKEIVEEIIDEKLKESKNYIFVSTAKYKVLVARLKRIIVKALKYIIGTLVNSKFEILGTELEFTQNGKYKPIILELEDGKKIEIIGKIDRIDVAKSENGSYLRIIDYKSSAKNIDLNEVYAGLQIQLITYLDAACKQEDFLPAGVLYFSLLEQMIKADKKMTEEEIENKIKSNFKMKGLILADVKVVKMHDKNLDAGASSLIPAYIDKSGNLSEKKTSGVSQKQFKILQEYMYKTIKEISKEILSGNIDLKPFYKKGNTACKYCEFKPICGFDTSICKNEYNFIGENSKEEILEKMEKQI
jgi:ATP-dependent helicase/nuclease subunit B